MSKEMIRLNQEAFKMNEHDLKMSRAEVTY